MVPLHIKGCGGGGGISCEGTSNRRTAQPGLVCGLILPLACAGHHPTLLVFGFRAGALHSTFGEYNLSSVAKERES